MGAGGLPGGRGRAEGHQRPRPPAPSSASRRGCCGPGCTCASATTTWPSPCWADLRDEAEVYNARGDVRLVEAESLVAQGRPDDAAALLESMPADWQTAKVKSRASDMLGLPLPGARRLGGGAQRLPGRPAPQDRPGGPRAHRTGCTPPSRITWRPTRAWSTPRGRAWRICAWRRPTPCSSASTGPRQAAELYAAAAADSAADPPVAARALYGALLTCRDHLDAPDTAAVFADQLQERYPASPQAFEARNGGQADLLGYLMARRQEEQDARLAAMTPEERLALETGEGAVAGAGGRAAARRRQRPAAPHGLSAAPVQPDLPAHGGGAGPGRQDQRADRAVAARVRPRPIRCGGGDAAAAPAAGGSCRHRRRRRRRAGRSVAGRCRRRRPVPGPADSLAAAAAAAARHPAQSADEQKQAQDEQEEKDKTRRRKRSRTTFDLREPWPAPGPGWQS